MRNYELMVVIDSSSDAEKIDRTVNKIQETLTEKGGKILSVDHWGRRRLAYEIQRRQYGFYVLFTFEFDPKVVKDLNRLLRLNQMVLRHLIVMLDPKAMAMQPRRPKEAAIETPDVIPSVIGEVAADVIDEDDEVPDLKEALPIQNDPAPEDKTPPASDEPEATPEQSKE